MVVVVVVVYVVFGNAMIVVGSLLQAIIFSPLVGDIATQPSLGRGKEGKCCSDIYHVLRRPDANGWVGGLRGLGSLRYGTSSGA